MQANFCRLVRAILVVFPLCVSAQQYPPELPGARAEIYKTVDGVDLSLWVYEPADHSQSQSRPAIVFFFGGGYRQGSPAQFRNQAKYLASRGMVAIVADYRVLSRHGTMVDAAIQDGQDAIKWVRDNARRLGVDPQKVAASGGSAGGHLAAMTATMDANSETASRAATSHVPNALILFNPALIFAPVDGHPETLDGPPSRNGPITKGLDREALSPYHRIRSGLPPTIIFHGTADQTVPLSHIELYTAASKACRQPM